MADNEKPGKHKKDKAGRARNQLTDNDHELWERLAQSVEPLHRHKKDRVHRSAVTSDNSNATQPPPSKQMRKPTMPAAPKPAAHAKIPVSGPPPLSNFDHKAARKIRSGRTAIDARLDLHGLRQHEAHDALRRFLNSAQAQGRRVVLVITGKGTHDFRRHADNDFTDFGALRETGVLKRLVPQWLAEPELRAIVVSYQTASPNHGGEGAIYIRLRASRSAHRK